MRTIAVALLVLGGCLAHNGTREAEGWARADVTPALAREAERDQEPRLQVIVCYGRILSNHSTLRITCPGRPPLFWDPGGEYLEREPERAGRKADLILGDPPTLTVFWETRHRRYSEPFMEVYEYDLDDERARELHDALMAGIDPDNDFQADRPPLGCCFGVCDYLQRYMTDRVELDKQYFMPHNLGWVLWDQNPTRVLIFREDEGVETYLPDARRVDTLAAKR